MENTTNYNLKKPQYIDAADIMDINDNMDVIDTEIDANHQNIETHKADTATIVKIKRDVTVLQTGWVDDTGDSGYWLYDVTDADVTANRAVDVYIHLESLDDASMLLPVNKSDTGKFTLYANAEPQEDIMIDYSILNQIGGV